MHFFTELDARVAALSGLLPADVSVETLGSAVQGLDDAQVVALAEFATQGRHLFEQVSLAASAVISERSTRAAGHAGLAQSRGFRTPAAFIQQVTGVSRNTALQQIRVGETLLEQEPMVMVSTGTDGDTGTDGVPVEVPVRQALWHAPLKTALVTGMLSSAQHDAIKRGLGEPPTADGVDVSSSLGFAGGSDAGRVELDPDGVQAWSLAAEQLVSYATEVPVEELAKQARAVRDLLDPVGAEVRFLARYEQRSFRMWTDRDGLTHGRFVFDDESAEWIRTIIDTALRPRRGGPRFVSADEQARANELQRDTRSNEQLTHDLLIDVLQAGSVADAETVFGVRQAGIKLVQVVNRDDYLAGTQTAPKATVTRFQESGTILPKSVAAKQRCNTGVQPVIVDEAGDPLQVGREQRLFTTKQRVALAVRDGGCRWTGCDRPASYCEAHHIDEWVADQGRTDIDRGVLLCAFHHLQLHNNGWKITREGRGPFLLHEPPSSAASGSARPGSTPATSLKTRSTEHSWSLEKPGPSVEGTSVPTSTGWSGGALPEQGKPTERAVSAERVEPVELRPPLPLTYAWQLATPRAKRFRAAA